MELAFSYMFPKPKEEIVPSDQSLMTPEKASRIADYVSDDV